MDMSAPGSGVLFPLRTHQEPPVLAQGTGPRGSCQGADVRPLRKGPEAVVPCSPWRARVPTEATD